MFRGKSTNEDIYGWKGKYGTFLVVAAKEDAIVEIIPDSPQEVGGVRLFLDQESIASIEWAPDGVDVPFQCVV